MEVINWVGKLKQRRRISWEKFAISICVTVDVVVFMSLMRQSQLTYIFCM